MVDNAPKDQTRSRADWLVDRAVAGAVAIGRGMPGRLQARLALSLARTGFRRQKASACNQLRYIWPDLPDNQAATIALQSIENVIRGTFEIADARRLLAQAANWKPAGPGLAVLEHCRTKGQAAILVTGHFGNWEAARAALTHRGHEIGGLYRPLNNGFLDDRWKAILSGLSGPVFPRGRPGLRGLLGYLRAGGSAVMLPDQFMAGGEILDFLGQPAPTSLAAAELALRFDAPLIPFYGIRRPDFGFEIVLEAPIARGTPAEMMQAFNDSLAARITATPEQWLWTHRRWKPGRVERMQQQSG